MNNAEFHISLSNVKRNLCQHVTCVLNNAEFHISRSNVKRTLCQHVTCVTVEVLSAISDKRRTRVLIVCLSGWKANAGISVVTVYSHISHDFHADVNSSNRVFWRRNTDTPRGKFGRFIGFKSQHFDAGLAPSSKRAISTTHVWT